MKDASLKTWRKLLKPFEINLKYIYIFIYLFIYFRVICILQKKNEKVFFAFYIFDYNILS